MARVRLDKPTIERKTFYQMTIPQQAQAERLVAHHAKHVEFMRPEEYAKCIRHWQVNSYGDVVGWICSHPSTAVSEDVT